MDNNDGVGVGVQIEEFLFSIAYGIVFSEIIVNFWRYVEYIFSTSDINYTLMFILTLIMSVDWFVEWVIYVHPYTPKNKVFHRVFLYYIPALIYIQGLIYYIGAVITYSLIFTGYWLIDLLFCVFQYHCAKESLLELTENKLKLIKIWILVDLSMISIIGALIYILAYYSLKEYAIITVGAIWFFDRLVITTLIENSVLKRQGIQIERINVDDKEVIIRDATYDDLDAIWEINLNAFRDVKAAYYQGLTNKKEIVKMMQNEHYIFKVLEYENKLIGFAIVAIDSTSVNNWLCFDKMTYPPLDAEKTAYFIFIAIRPDYQSMGIGTIFYNYIEDKIRKIGKKYIYIDVDCANKVSLNFSRKIGFKTKGCTLWMVKELS